MSSISRRRNGLMALSVIGDPVLRGGSRPLNLKTGRPLSLLHLRYQLPRERFSPMPHTRPWLNYTCKGRRGVADTVSDLPDLLDAQVSKELTKSTISDVEPIQRCCWQVGGQSDI